MIRVTPFKALITLLLTYLLGPLPLQVSKASRGGLGTCPGPVSSRLFEVWWPDTGLYTIEAKIISNIIPSGSLL